MEVSTDLSEEQILISMNQYDFERLRKTNPMKYKVMIKQYIKIYQPPNLQELAMSIIKKPGDERNEDEILILQLWTNSFKFFEDLNSKSMNVELKLHQKCCGRIKYEKVSKGQIVFKAGDLPEKFYIVLSGSVNVMMPKSSEQLKQDLENERQKTKNLKGQDQKNTLAFKIQQIKDRKYQQMQELRRMSKYHNLTGQNPPNKMISLKMTPSKSKQFKNQIFQIKQSQYLINSTSPSNRNTLLPNSQKQSIISLQNQVYVSQFNENEERQSLIASSHSPKNIDTLWQFQQDDKRFSNQSISFGSKLSPGKKDSFQQDFQQNTFTQSGSFFGELKSLPHKKDSQQSDNLQIPITKINSIIGEASISPHKKDSLQDQIANFIKQGSIESTPNSENGDQVSESNLSDFSSQLKIEEFPVEDEKDALYKLLGDIQLEAIQDLDNFFIEGVPRYKFLLTLNTGSMFGELGLLLKKPRAATILAREDTEFAILNADDYSKILYVGEMKQINQRIQFFTQNFLQGCGREVVTKYSYNFKCVKYTLGNVIYSQGDPSQFVYIVKKGLIETKITTKGQKSQIKNANSVSKVLNALKHQDSQAVQRYQREKICLSVISVGQCFGEIEVIKNTPRISHAICTTNKVTLWVLPASIFQKLINENKFLNQQFLNQIKLKEKWYQKQDSAHKLQKDVLKEKSDIEMILLSKQKMQNEISKRKYELEKSFSLQKNSPFKGDDEEIEKHIKLQLLQEELQKDMKELQGLKEIGASELLKRQEMVKVVEISGIKKQIHYNMIQQHQEKQQDFDQQVFHVMKKIQQQKKQMQDLIRRIMIKNAYKFMPKKKFNEFNGMDIKHALNLQIFQQLRNHNHLQLPPDFTLNFEKSLENEVKQQLEDSNNSAFVTQQDQVDHLSDLQQTKHTNEDIKEQFFPISLTEENNHQNSSQKQFIPQPDIQQQPIKEIQTSFRNNTDGRIRNKTTNNFNLKNENSTSKRKLQICIPQNSQESYPNNILSEKNQTLSAKGSLSGIGSFQKLFQTCRTLREGQKLKLQQQNKQQNIQNNEILNCEQVQKGNLCKKISFDKFSQQNSQRQSISSYKPIDEDLAKSFVQPTKRSSLQQQTTHFNSSQQYSSIQSNIHSNQMKTHSSVFTVCPFFYTKNQQNQDIQKILVESHQIRKQNQKCQFNPISNKETPQISNSQEKESIKGYLKKGEYFHKTHEELQQCYNFYSNTLVDPIKENKQSNEIKEQTANLTIEKQLQQEDNQEMQESQRRELSNDQSTNQNQLMQFQQILLRSKSVPNSPKRQKNNSIQTNKNKFRNSNENFGTKATICSQSTRVSPSSIKFNRQQQDHRERRFSNQQVREQFKDNNLQNNLNSKLHHKSNVKEELQLAPQSMIIKDCSPPIFLEDDSYLQKNFYMSSFKSNCLQKSNLQGFNQSLESISNQQIEEYPLKNIKLQASLSQSLSAQSKKDISNFQRLKQNSLSPIPKKQNFVEFNRHSLNQNKNYNQLNKRQALITSIRLQAYEENFQQKDNMNQQSIINQLTLCRLQNKSTKYEDKLGTQDNKFLKIKKQLLNLSRTNTERSSPRQSKLKNFPTTPSSTKIESNIGQSKIFSEGKQFREEVMRSTGASFYPSFDEVGTQLLKPVISQGISSPKNVESSQLLYNQKSFTKTKHNMFRQKPEKLYLLQNSINYPYEIQKIDQQLKPQKVINIK